MPNIEQLNLTPSQVDIRPSELGVEAAVQAGRRIGTFSHQLGETVGRTTNIIGQSVVKHNEDIEKQSLLNAWTSADVQDREDFDSFMNMPENQGNPHAAMEYYEQYSKPRYDGLMATAKTDGGKLFAQNLYDRSVKQSFDHSATAYSQIAGQQHITAIENRAGYYSAKVGSGEMTPDEAHAALQSDLAGTNPQTGGRAEFANPGEAAEQEGVYMRQADKDFATRYFDGRMNRIEDGVASGQNVDAQIKSMRDDLANGKYAEQLGTSERDFNTELSSRIAQGQERLRVSQASVKQAGEMDTMAKVGRIRALLLPNANGDPPDPRAASEALKQINQLLHSPDPVVAATAGREAEGITGVIRTQAEDRLTSRFTQDDPTALATINQRKTIAPGQPGALSKVDLDNMRIAHQISDGTYEKETRRLDDLTSNPGVREAEGRVISSVKSVIGPELMGGAGLDVTGTDSTNTADLFGSTKDPKGAAAVAIAINQVTAEFETLVAQGVNPEQAYRQVTDPQALALAMPTWKGYAANGLDWASQHPATYGVLPPGFKPGGAQTAPRPSDSAAVKIQSAGPIKAGESWSAYKARAGF